MSQSFCQSIVASEPAFPCDGPNAQAFGLTKREYIATVALQGILAHSHNDASFEGAARDAVEHADCLLLELAK
jgi:hypothetical protein